MRLILALGVVLATSSAVQAADPTFPSSAGNLTVHTVAQGLSHPWSLAFLPDGRMLVTERPGRMRIVAPNGQLSPPLANVPKVFAVSQGGLLDVILDRNFARTAPSIFPTPSVRQWRAHRTGARPARGRRGPAARRREGHLPPAGPGFAGKPLRGPHRAGRGRHAVPHQWRAFHRPRHGAEARQRPRQDHPDYGRTAPLRPTIRSSRKPVPVPKSGHMATAIRKVSPSTRLTAGYGSRNTAAKGGDEINLIVAGHNYGWPLVSLWRQLRWLTGRHRQSHIAGMEIRSGIGRRQSRHQVWQFIPVIFSRLEGQPVQRRTEIPAAVSPRDQGRQGRQRRAHAAGLE